MVIIVIGKCPIPSFAPEQSDLETDNALGD